MCVGFAFCCSSCYFWSCGVSEVFSWLVEFRYVSVFIAYLLVYDSGPHANFLAFSHKICRFPYADATE